MAVDTKYGRVTFEREPHTPIADDEPVFILRAQDVIAPETIIRYASLCSERGSPQAHVDAVMEVYDRFVRWQQEHSTKVPD